MTREEAEVLEALMRRLDKQNAKIKRVEWVIAEIKKECDSDLVMKTIDIIEKVMEA